MSDEKEHAGIKFNPDDEELINHYLMNKTKNEPCGNCGKYIVSKDVYAEEPWLLDRKNKDKFFDEDAWFYFATRTKTKDNLKTGRGKKDEAIATRHQEEEQ